MSEDPTKSWWATLPGVLTAIAGIITAVTGLIIALHSSDSSNLNSDRPKPEETSIQTFSPPAGEGVTRSGAMQKQSTLPADNRVANNRGSSSVKNIATRQKAKQSTIHEDTPYQGDAKDASSGEQATPMKANLLSSENGGQIISGSGDGWATTIDGNERYTGSIMVGEQAVFAFKDERPATFDTFTILTKETSEYNIKEFELFAGTDSPTGPFHSIGKFTTQNTKLFKTPYQEFKFAPVRAKYLKVKILSSHGGHYIYAVFVYEIQLLGQLD